MTENAINRKLLVIMIPLLCIVLVCSGCSAHEADSKKWNSNGNMIEHIHLGHCSWLQNSDITIEKVDGEFVFRRQSKPDAEAVKAISEGIVDGVLDRLEVVR